MTTETTNLFSIELTICATAYIKADTIEEAIAKAKALAGQSPTILDHDGGVAISGCSYGYPDLPEVSLSPAMTIHETWNDAEPELAEEGVPRAG